jgi:hypothetical protein
MTTPSLLEQLAREGARDRTLARARAALLALCVLAATGAAAVWLLGGGRWISLPPLLPLFGLLAVLVATAAAGFAAWRGGERDTGSAAVARAVEGEWTLRRGSVSGLMELGDHDGVSARAAARLAAALPGGELAPERRRRAGRAVLAGIGALLLTTAGFTWSGARNDDGLRALLHPVSAARGDLLPPLRLVHVPLAVARGSSFEIDIEAAERGSVRLHTRVPGSPWETVPLRVEGGRARAQLGPLASTTTVYVSDARGRSDTAVVRVLDRPFVSELSLRAVYPAVFGRPSEPLPPGGQLLLPAGTTLHVRGVASVPLSSADLSGSGIDRALEVTDRTFTGSLTISGSGTLEWRITASDGQAVEPPPALQVALIGDALPEVEILVPTADTTISGDQPVRVVVRAGDDHELRSVVLRARGGESQRIVPLAIPPAGGSATIALDVTGSAPGAHIVIDAVAIEGGGSGRQVSSAPRTIRLMTAAEQRAAARSAADAATATAREISAAQQQMERRTGEAARARGARNETGAGEQSAGHALAERARSIVDEQRSLGARADSLAAVTRALESRLARAGGLDDGLAARLAEVRSLLERALTPELAARLREAEQAARDNADEPLRRALSDITREQRRAREQLERVVQMLRRAAIEGALETLRAEAAEIAREPSAADAPARTRELERDIGGVLERMAAERARAGVPPTRTALEHTQSAARTLQGRERAGAPGALAAAAGALAQARSAQIAEWKEELASDLDAAVQELVQLAAKEEALARSVAAGAPDWRSEHAGLEEAATAVADRVSRAARSSTLVSSRSDGLVRAARDQVVRVAAPSFPPRDRTQTSAMMRDAAGSLSRAAASLVRDRERTNTARSASGFTELLEELQRLAREQRGLNAAAAGLPLGFGASEQGREQARTLARQQRGIARSLEEIGDADGGARAQPLAAEAHRLADALERAGVDGSVVARQERLYHRLLEGGRLLTGDSGEDDDRREAIAARSTEFRVLDERVLPAGQRRYAVPGWSELRSLTPSERQMIVEYFERLNGAR